MRITGPILTLFLGSAIAFPAAGQDSVSFNWDVRPILSENCYTCHGPDDAQRKADLRLDTRESLADPERSLIDPDNSEFLNRITSDDPDNRMPPPEHGDALTEEQITVLTQWVKQGAPYEPHWSLVKPKRSDPPALGQTDHVQNDVDRFIAALLGENEITPSPEADKHTLIRRAYLDLIGIPPTPEQVDAFLNDTEPGAYERVVDQLLESPHFGERWGRHWLDYARYADSNGYSIDAPRSIWPYRDWVIDAYNDNKPFNEFVLEQIAGDMLPDATTDQRVATGFHRNTMINEEGGIDKEEFRVKAVIDRVNTTGAVFFGLTVGCAQCHTHKYDPITADEYYGLFAFYNNDDYANEVVSPEAVVEERRRLDREASDLSKVLRQYIDSMLPEWEAGLDDEARAKLPESIQSILSTEQRNEDQTKTLREHFAKTDDAVKTQQKAIDEVRAKRSELDTSMILRARSEPRETKFLVMGDYTQPGHTVEPHVPASLHPMDATENPTRLDLAQWIVDPENPLTARVAVNRVWMRLFGRGIVETDNDFGTQGARPTHPALLDWLATEFVDSGWDRKALIRLIATSATYRQASNERPELATVDAENRLLARQSRVRLDAEIIRDSGLAVAGLLDDSIGGPSVFPPQPDGVMNLGQRSRPWNVSDGGDRYRRGMYTFFWRATPHPALMVFDAPDATTTCTRRNRSNTPLQALTLLNDAAYHEMAMALGDRLAEMNAPDDARIQQAFEWCLTRQPSPRETAIVARLLQQSRAANEQPWHAVARAMLNLDEFITRE